MFRVVVVGLGVQGPKRIAAAGPDVMATVDVAKPADFKSLQEVPLDAYDAALLCVPDDAKPGLLDHLASHGKHALVEKPLLMSEAALSALQSKARANNAFVYTAYNHRFEPHFMRVQQVIASGVFGRIYRLRLFYGNGTARLVRDSEWRDRGAGVVPDLGSHLLDTVSFWLGGAKSEFRVVSARKFENRSADHVVLLSDGDPEIELEMTLLSWRNRFEAEIFGERALATVSSLCKWGPSTFRLYRRVLPAGRPPEDVETLEMPDPTWDAEYQYFRARCLEGQRTDLSTDRWIGKQLQALSETVMASKKQFA
ncbi:MAG: Gfo/Idh/MocA family protein [Pseudorhodoplanes sp.]